MLDTPEMYFSSVLDDYCDSFANFDDKNKTADATKSQTPQPQNSGTPEAKPVPQGNWTEDKKNKTMVYTYNNPDGTTSTMDAKNFYGTYGQAAFENSVSAYNDKNAEGAKNYIGQYNGKDKYWDNAMASAGYDPKKSGWESNNETGGAMRFTRADINPSDGQPALTEGTQTDTQTNAQTDTTTQSQTTETPVPTPQWGSREEVAKLVNDYRGNGGWYARAIATGDQNVINQANIARDILNGKNGATYTDGGTGINNLGNDKIINEYNDWKAGKLNPTTNATALTDGNQSQDTANQTKEVAPGSPELKPLDDAIKANQEEADKLSNVANQPTNATEEKAPWKFDVANADAYKNNKYISSAIDQMRANGVSDDKINEYVNEVINAQVGANDLTNLTAPRIRYDAGQDKLRWAQGDIASQNHTNKQIDISKKGSDKNLAQELAMLNPEYYQWYNARKEALAKQQQEQQAGYRTYSVAQEYVLSGEE